jgi:hypothetical protein
MRVATRRTKKRRLKLKIKIKITTRTRTKSMEETRKRTGKSRVARTLAVAAVKANPMKTMTTSMRII